MSLYGQIVNINNNHYHPIICRSFKIALVVDAVLL